MDENESAEEVNNLNQRQKSTTRTHISRTILGFLIALTVLLYIEARRGTVSWFSRTEHVEIRNQIRDDAVYSIRDTGAVATALHSRAVL
jgi:hypothetical protein